MLYAASGEQFLKIDKVTEKPADEFLYYCNFIAEKNSLEIAKIKSTSNI